MSIDDASSLRDRIDSVDWPGIFAQLDAAGWALLPNLLPAERCDAVAEYYDDDTGFRARVVMSRHGYGRGEYKYFSAPLPPALSDLRGSLYGHMVPLANRWNERMGVDVRYPASHGAFLERCHRDGQTRPTPLLLRYGPGDYNCLHQDLYGAHVFPLQVAILLAAPGVDFLGGEFIMTEQRPRMQSRPWCVPLGKGDAVVFAVNQRPVRGSRGDYRTVMRHGVSLVHSGLRHTLGIIFHDAA